MSWEIKVDCGETLMFYDSGMEEERMFPQHKEKHGVIAGLP